MTYRLGIDYSYKPAQDDVFIVTGHVGLENPAGLNLAGTHVYMMSLNGSVPDIGSTGVNYGDVAVRSILGPNPDGTYETTHAILSSDRGGTAISGQLIVGTIEANGQLARGNLAVTYGRPDSYFSLGSSVFIYPQSSLAIVPDRGNSPHLVNEGNTVDYGGIIYAAVDVGGNGNFNLESYLIDPRNTSGAVAIFEGGLTMQSMHVGFGSQVNFSKPLAVHGSITEDPVSQVVLRGTTATSFSYQGGMLDVRNGSVQVADLQIAPANGANGFSLVQFGDATVIQAIGMSAQQAAQTSMPTAVLHYGS